MNPQNMAVVMAVLFGISEALANIPVVKANSVFQMVQNVLGSLKAVFGIQSGTKA